MKSHTKKTATFSFLAGIILTSFLAIILIFSINLYFDRASDSSIQVECTNLLKNADIYSGNGRDREFFQQFNELCVIRDVGEISDIQLNRYIDSCFNNAEHLFLESQFMSKNLIFCIPCIKFRVEEEVGSSELRISSEFNIPYSIEFNSIDSDSLYYISLVSDFLENEIRIYSKSESCDMN